jgi:hypothetical protein
MLALDQSLSELISAIPASELSSSSGGKAPAPVQANTPLPIRRALEATRLKRARAQAALDRQSGIVRAKHTSDDLAHPALTKRQFRSESGQEAKRRKAARGIGGAIGKWGAGTLSLSRDEIERGGDVRRTPDGKGGYDGLGGSRGESGSGRAKGRRRKH